MGQTDFSQLGISEITHRFPNIAGTYSGRLIIAAGAKCVWDDLEQSGVLKKDNESTHVMCVNDIIMHYPGKLHHAYSNNHQYLPKWMAARRDQYLTRWKYKTLTHSNQAGGQYTWPFPGHGTSSLNAVYVALALGYDKIELCGVPLDNTPHYFEPDHMKTNFLSLTDDTGGPRYWRSVAPIFEGRVKSWSGRTRELLGEPNW